MATDEAMSFDTDCYEYMFVCSICSEISTDAVCKNDHTTSNKTPNKRSFPADSTSIDYENLINPSIVSSSALEPSLVEKVRKGGEFEGKPTNGKSTSAQSSRKLLKPIQQTYVCPECGDISTELACKNDHSVDLPKDVCDRCKASFDSVDELIKHSENPTSCLPPLQHYFVPFHDVRIVTMADSKHIFYDLGKPIVLSLPDNFASMVQKGTLGMGQYQVVAAFPDSVKAQPNLDKSAEISELDDSTDVVVFDPKDPVDELLASDEATSSGEIQASKATDIKAETSVTTQKVVLRTYPHCVVCDVGFISIDSLITHCVSHGEPLDFQCQFCLRHYNRAYWFKTHLKTHARQLPLVCQFCDESFLIAEQYRNHLHKVHGLDENGAQQLLQSEHHDSQFICMACGRWFKSKFYLELHSQLSHPEKETILSSNAVSNEKETAIQNPTEATHNKPSTNPIPSPTPKKSESKKPIHVFECNICSATIRSIEEVRQHLSQHARSRLYKCEVCSGRFLSPKQLQGHKCRRPTTKKEEIHRCAKCDKAFNHAAGLACHLKTHSDDRSEGFSCEKCSLKFKILSSYLIHRSQAH